MTATDIVWGQYTRAVASHKTHKACVMAVLIILTGAFVTTAYVENPWMLVPAVFGAYIGTWLALLL